MLKTKISEKVINKNVTEKFKSYSYINTNIQDILNYSYIKERTLNEFKQGYIFLEIQNLKNFKKKLLNREYSLKAILTDLHNIPKGESISHKHLELLKENKEIYAICIKQINDKEVQNLLKEEEEHNENILNKETRKTFIKQLIKSINKRIKTLLKEKKIKPMYKLNEYDIYKMSKTEKMLYVGDYDLSQLKNKGILAYDTTYNFNKVKVGILTGNAKKVLYYYLRGLKAHKPDSHAKIDYMIDNEYIKKYFNTEHHIRLEGNLKRSINKHIEFKFQFLLFVNDGEKDKLRTLINNKIESYFKTINIKL